VAFTAVVNPSAGRGRTRKLLPRLTAALHATERDTEVVVASSLDDARRHAARAFLADRTVVACGGDGLVAELAGLAAEHPGVLGIVPTGAGNDFARHLGYDHRRPLDAVGALAEGHVAVVDLAKASTGDGATRWFTSVANTGFDAEANRWANGVTWARGTTLYVLAMLRTLAVYRPRRFRLTVDATTTDVEAWLVAVGNGRGYAGGMVVTPGAELDDGCLDVCIVGPVSRPDFLRSFPKVFRGTHTTHPQVTMLRGARVDVEFLDGAPLDLYASGERAGPLPAKLEAAPGALQVLVPRNSPYANGAGARD